MQKQSPLFWPIKLKEKTIYVLDETQLPQKPVYIKCKNTSEVVRVVKDMKTRAFGQVAITFYTFLMVLEKNKNVKSKALLNILAKTAKSIEGARPTFPFKDFTGMVLHWAGEAVKNNQDIKTILEKNINGFLTMIRRKRIAQAEKAAVLVDDKDCVLTHCNLSGILPLMAQIAKKQNKRIKFIATETRPYFQGSRLTAWELNYTGFEVIVIPDGAVAKVMQEGRINKVIVGADCLAKNGDFANKIGTYQIALLAKKFNIPFYVLTPPASNYKTGCDIPIEIRPDSELLKYKGINLSAKGVKGYYPAFDITLNQLVTKHIGLI